jgi:hypothetical protein
MASKINTSEREGDGISKKVILQYSFLGESEPRTVALEERFRYDKTLEAK